VHNVTIKPILYGSFAARLTGVPGVVNAVSGRGYMFLARGFGASIQRRIVRLLYRAAFDGRNTRVIFQNADDLAAFTGRGLVARDKTILIEGGSGVDLELYRALPEPGPPAIVVLAARLLADKGVREFASAAETLKIRFPHARFVLVGPMDDPNPTVITQKELDRWTRHGSVEWWGKRSDVPEIFAASHIVCLPSYMEGMPKVLLEAAACARPVITTDVPGCRDAIVPGETGLLVPVKDVPALAAAIESLLENAAERTRLGSNGRRLAERRFGVAAVVKRTLDLYDEISR
jgi:glycosyltransferase involved in cell wall biosynthesis